MDIVMVLMGIVMVLMDIVMVLMDIVMEGSWMCMLVIASVTQSHYSTHLELWL